jgi:hypothetical protein
LPVSDFRISICRLNDRQLTGLLRGCLLLWLFSETNLTAFKSVYQGFGKFIHNRGVPSALR